jgi:hypothetical protein
MVDDATAQCIEACLEISTTAADAASYCLRWGGDYAAPERVNALVTCSAVTQMIADQLRTYEVAEDELLTLGIDVCVNAGKVCGELDDPQLRPCQLAASACAEALRTLQAAVD